MPKKTPMRMCVGCRNMFPKRDLIRIVRPIKSKALERALERKLDGELLERLGRELEHG